MKKTALLLALLCLLAAVCTACGSQTQEQDPQAFDISGQTATVSFADETHSSGTVSTANGDYAFAYDTDGDLNITYPDGYVYTQFNLEGAIAVPTSYDAEAVEAKGYLDGMALGQAIETAMQSGGGWGGPSIFLAFVLVALGAWNLCAPKSSWWIAHGWTYRKAEPSELALRIYRVTGGVLLLLGILCAAAAS